MVMVNWQRWGPRAEIMSVFLGGIVWFAGLCLTGFAILAKAYDFSDWIEDDEDEGELRLESDDEGDMNIGVLGNQAV